MRRLTGYLSIGEQTYDAPPLPGPPGGGYFGKGPGMGKGRVFGGPWGNDKETDSFTCAHCCTVVFVKPFCDPADLGGVCHKCGTSSKPSYLCPECTNKGGCDPYEEKLKRWEARDNFRRDWDALT